MKHSSFLSQRSPARAGRPLRRAGAAASLIAGLILLGAASPALADTVSLEPSKDNTLFSNNTSFSNGVGVYFFSGKTISFGVRRAVLAFDLTSIPAGSTVSSASLTLHVSMTISAPKNFSLHRATANWGEGASDAGSPGGNGTSAQPEMPPGSIVSFPYALERTQGDFAAASYSGRSARTAAEQSDRRRNDPPTSGLVTRRRSPLASFLTGVE
jgi:hypothetical protein